MIPYSKAALTVAPSVAIPDAIFLVFVRAQRFLRHSSAALLVVWDRDLWDWNDPPRSALREWLSQLPQDQYYFLRTMEGHPQWCECLGHWQDNPFELDYLGAVDYVPHGVPVTMERMTPHPDRLTRQFTHGRQSIRRMGPTELRSFALGRAARRPDIRVE
jgi:hypothetical protein